MSLDQRMDLLEHQMASLRREVRELTEWLDVLGSPWWKRWLWFVPQGWRPYRPGRWY